MNVHFVVWIDTCSYSSDFSLLLYVFSCKFQVYLLFWLVFLNLFLMLMICSVHVPIYRSFVDDVGYEDRSVSKLRNKLSSLLTGTSFTESWSLSVQFTAIGALVSVLPLPFDKIATESRQLSGSFVVQVKEISEWFVQLSSEHQSLARSFFSWKPGWALHGPVKSPVQFWCVPAQTYSW